MRTSEMLAEYGKSGMSQTSAARHTSGRGFAVNRSDAAIDRKFQNVVCMTLYNEDFAMVRTSLAALIESIAMHETRGNEAATVSAHSCIAIVADGLDRLDPRIVTCFRDAGLLNSGADFSACGEEVVYSRRPAAAILASLGYEGDPGVDISFAVCLKARNQGKLHSHAVFFRGICEKLSPRYCYQIDVGTIVARNAMTEIVGFMDQHPSVAAAASRILTPAPAMNASPLDVWQYMDFVAQKAITWPTEVASGYLSIIPGQFCVLRWSAIDQSRSARTGLRAADSYLRGLKDGSPLERVMFLAEDRVLASEIVLAEHESWIVGYCREAEATTDVCESFDELLRQRRRWLNSSLAVRIWLWARWPAYLGRKDKSVADKLRFSNAMVWQGLLAGCELVSPAFLVLLLCAAFAGVAAAQSALVAVTTVSFAATAILTALSFGMTDRRWGTRFGVASNISAGVSVAMLTGCTIYFHPPIAAAILLSPMVAMAVAIAAAFPRERWAVLQRFPLYLLLDRVILPTLYVYSLANMHNVTWGTKGLVAETEEMRSNKARMSLLRNVVAGIVLVINLALVAVGLAYHGLLAESASIVIEVVSLLYLGISTTAIGTHFRSATTAALRDVDPQPPLSEVRA